jgi:DNA-directed RNA polymerase specialized sigma24 family protein/CheY-like chemotaxis protein
MSNGREISPYIPYLRRFGRALTGSQQSGDALVLKALENIMANPATFRAGPNPRVALYRAFLRAWDADGNRDEQPDQASADERGARENLATLDTRQRVVFLLSALEGFETIDIAAILDKPIIEIEPLLEGAGRAIQCQLHTQALIIEDEPFIALDLKSLLEELGHKVIAIARTCTDAIAAVGAQKPGLILADIQLADGSSGLDAVNTILKDGETPVIFITAYPERYLTGKPPEPAFLITKPFSSESLKAVISQALFFGRKSKVAPAAPL